MRTISFVILLAFLMGANAVAQAVHLAPIPMPIPFPQGSSIFQWDYQCTGTKGCGLTGLGLDSYSLKSASIVLANLKIGDIEMPTYFVWGSLLDGSSVSAMIQDAFSIRFVAVNMKLTAAGAPGL
jgi:hypothetical protein